MTHVYSLFMIPIYLAEEPVEAFLLVHLVAITSRNSFRNQGDTKAQDIIEGEDRASEVVLHKVGISVVALEEDIVEVTEEEQEVGQEVAMDIDVVMKFDYNFATKQRIS